MKISCPTCSAKYTIADDKVRGKTVKIKCKKCGGTIVAGESDAGGAPMGASGEMSLASPAGSGEWMVNVGEGDQRTLTAEQIAELHTDGTIGDDTYIWRDGMAEWLPVVSVPEVSALLKPKAAAAPPPEEMDEGQPTMMAPAAGFAPMGGLPRPAAGAPAPAARRADAARNNRDLFQAAAAPPAEEEDDPVTRIGSTAELSMGGSGYSAPAPASMGFGAARRNAPAPALIDNNDASGILDIRKLQGALASKQETKKEEKFDDIMNLGGGALFSSSGSSDMSGLAPPDFSAPPPPEPEPPRSVAAAPTPMGAPMPTVEPPKKSKGPLAAIGVVALLVASIGGTVFVMGKKADESKAAAVADVEKKAADDKKASDDKKAADDKKTADAKAADPKAADAKPDDKKIDDKAADPEHAAAAGKELTPEEKKRRDEAFKKKKEDDEKKKKEEEDKKKKEEEDKKKKEAEAAAPAAAGGTAPFDRASANSALSSIAAAAASCKKADGPTGSGRISVTFAPSGRVTTTNIEGGPFAGSAVGSCVAGKFRSAKVPAFAGDAVTVKKTFTIN
jgi:predicted Zn finger-like uncharacterized protein